MWTLPLCLHLEAENSRRMFFFKSQTDAKCFFLIMTIIALAPTRPKVAALKLEETAKYCNFCLVSGIPRAWFFSMEQLVIWSETSVINNKLDRFVN